MNSTLKRIVAMLLALCMMGAMLAACDNSDEGEDTTASDSAGTGTGDETDDPSANVVQFDSDATYTYNTYWASLAPNWNVHDYEDSSAADTFDYLIDGFYQFAFNDELHPMEDETREAYDGYVIIPSMAVGDPVDVTEEVKAEHPEWFPEDAESGYAYAITLRDDLYFDTGYHITAETYVTSAQYLLDPDLQNYRSTDVYSGSYGIVGAKAYFMQGTVDYIDNGEEGIQISDMTAGDDGQYTYSGVLAGADNAEVDGAKVYIAVGYALDTWLGGNTLQDYVEAYGDAYFGLDTWDELLALADENGLVPATDANLELLSGVTTTNANWGETDADLYNYLVIAYEWADDVDFSTVGIYALDEYTLVEVFGASVSGFTLYYNALQDSLILIEPDVYASCIAVDESGTTYSSYMTSVATSPSYGPYSMTDYQTDKMIHYSQNPYWYGWNDYENQVYVDPEDGLTYHTYMTTDIDVQVVTESSTAKQMFLSGELITYSMQTDDYDEYGFSEYLYASPSAVIYFLLLTGDMSGLQAREAAADFDTTKYDLETITVTSFRQAIAVAFDRQAFCDEAAPAQTPGLGIISDTNIYDADTAAFYRDSEPAMQALCDFYGVDASEFDSLEEAVSTITGYDVEQAKELFTAAYEEALAAGYITDTDNDGMSDQEIVMSYPSTAVTDALTKRIEWLNSALVTATEGTPFAGKISIEIKADYSGSEWAYALKDGSADICLCGWSGSALDPYSLMQAYTWPSYSYAINWYDTTTDMLTLTIDGTEITMSVYNWVEAMNGVSSADADGNMWNFGEGQTSQDNRLTILAGVEGKLLQTYTYIPFTTAGSKFLLSQKVYYVVEEYNPIMGRGGIMYMKYNYSDEEWAAYVAEQGGTLQY
ncbi:MAG: ABC transporter substrate-binding protein [Firmicutes bacterium]|nr:ABC transporter substrate-binding protein [Bacillota bacterium]